jgi:hypothetical protein
MMVGLYESVGGGFVCSSSHQGRYLYIPSEHARSARFGARDAVRHGTHTHSRQDGTTRQGRLGKRRASPAKARLRNSAV